MGIKVGQEIKVLPIVLIIVGVLFRLIPHPANVAPIVAVGLFGGVYLPKRVGLILPLVVLLVSDFFHWFLWIYDVFCVWKFFTFRTDWVID